MTRLALLDARTVSQEDVHPTILNIYDNSPGGQSGNVAGRGQDESELKVHDLDGNKLRHRKPARVLGLSRSRSRSSGRESAASILPTPGD